MLFRSGSCASDPRSGENAHAKTPVPANARAETNPPAFMCASFIDASPGFDASELAPPATSSLAFAAAMASLAAKTSHDESPSGTTSA